MKVEDLAKRIAVAVLRELYGNPYGYDNTWNSLAGDTQDVITDDLAKVVIRCLAQESTNSLTEQTKG